jgi:hypothetical protein
MRYVVLLVLGLGFLGLFFALRSPYYSNILTQKVPALNALVEDDVKANSEYKERNVSVPTVKVDRAQLTGAWRSEGENGELIFFRLDGKARIALAARYEIHTEAGVLWTATGTCVILADWEELGGNIRFKNGVAQHVEIKNMDMQSTAEGVVVDRFKAVSANNFARNDLKKEFKQHLEKYMVETPIGGAVTGLSPKRLTMVTKSGTYHYARENPQSSRDPDGRNAPIFELSSATAEPVRKPPGGGYGQGKRTPKMDEWNDPKRKPGYTPPKTPPPSEGDSSGSQSIPLPGKKPMPTRPGYPTDPED